MRTGVKRRLLPKARSCKMKRLGRRAVSRPVALDYSRTPPGARRPSPAPVAATVTQLDPLDVFVDPQIRLAIERTYCAHQPAVQPLRSPEGSSFFRRPRQAVALYSDRGVVHTRDVARQILEELDTVHGVLIPARHSHRRRLAR